LVKLGTLAASVGAAAGFWNIWAHFQSPEASGVFILMQQHAPVGEDGTIVLILAIVLALASLATFVAPASLFYVSAAASLLIDALELLSYSSVVQWAFWVTIVLTSLSLGLALLAGRRRTSVSEQSHPMNLPVFG
jgi:hypothetical protein